MTGPEWKRVSTTLVVEREYGEDGWGEVAIEVWGEVRPGPDEWEVRSLRSRADLSVSEEMDAEAQLIAAFEAGAFEPKQELWLLDEDTDISF